MTDETSRYPPDPLSDPALFKGFKDGDHQTYAKVVRLVESRLLAFLLPWLADREVAEEVAQEALILLYRNRDKISSGDKIVPWLFVTARRLAFKVARKSRQAPAAYGLDPAVIDEFADHCRSQLESLSLGQLASVLSSVLATLEPEEREIISLRYFSNLKHAEIAEVLDMPIGSVGVKLRRTLDKLKDRLTEKGISPESF